MSLTVANKFEEYINEEDCEALTPISATQRRYSSVSTRIMSSNTSNSVGIGTLGKEIEVVSTEGSDKSFENVRISSKKYPKRIVSKNGHINYVRGNIERRKWNYCVDICTTVLEASWSWTLFAFFVIYFGSWTIFAGGWYLIQFLHHDLEPDHIKNINGTWKACVVGIDSFTNAFLFSVETQHTTGYGFHELTDECPQAVLLFCFQSIVGIMIEGIMIGLVFVKVSRAKRRRATLLFSRNAVISTRGDGKPYFMFRVADMRKNPLIEPRIRAQFIRKRLTADGNLLRTSQQEFSVHGEGESSNRLFLLWPTTIIHEIDSSSPFYPVLKEEANYETAFPFEIVLILEGTLESTGQPMQARTSYLPHEILRGHHFHDLSEISGKLPQSGERVIDFSLFHNTFCPSDNEYAVQY